MPLKKVSCDAMVIPDEAIRQSGAGKVGFRLRKNTLLRPSVHAEEQCTVRETNLNRAGALDIWSLVEAHIFRHDFRSDFYGRFLVIRELAPPVLLPVVDIFIADGFEHLRIGS